MNNISNIRDCYGCGVCATACTMQIISIGLNDDGFYEPRITDATQCTGCGLCLSVCAYSHNDLSLKDRNIRSYGAWSKDEEVRRRCSSGGVGFELGRTLLGEGYKVCGVRFNAEANMAEHYIATTVEELIPSIGSKYIQSYTFDGFRSIDKNQKYLVTGTPCQIDSFRRYIRKFKKEDNFVLMDFFCHGVPSKLMWDKYVKWAEKKVGKLTYVSWRNKFTGWHDSCTMAIDGEEYGEPVGWYGSFNMLIRGHKSFLNSRWSQGDMFYHLFLSDACLGKACYERCKYKYDQSSADIRIGDAWGSYYKGEENGVSASIAYTEKGNEVLKMCNCELEPLPFDIVAEGQMKECPKRNVISRIIKRMLKKSTSNIRSVILVLKAHNYIVRQIQRVCHPFSVMSNLINIIRV